MNFKQIKELIELVDGTTISEVCIEQDELKVVIKTKHYHSGESSFSAPMIQQMPMAPAPVVPVAQPSAGATPSPAATDNSSADGASEVAADNLITVKSPMIGTFYRSPSPDKPPFIKIGDQVTPKSVLCIVEAMKLFNEIESEVSGKIVKILVDDASPVEYDQPLFLVQPD